MHNRYGGGHYVITWYLENWDRPHLPTASEVHFLRTSDLEEDKIAGNHATLVSCNTEFSFHGGNAMLQHQQAIMVSFKFSSFPQTKQIIRHPS